MKTYNDLILRVEELIEGDAALGNKYTKAESKRQRNRINEIQKLAVQAKRDLLEQDKK